ncbi:hypothetical protein AB0H43_21875 [Hamadaea sp. NPDC050747]|uniref:hypothetical protein n=1 Tax=Hamadaea sp. NPDC050747 TaxID=3155789 RepID=UPI0033DE0150
MPPAPPDPAPPIAAGISPAVYAIARLNPSGRISARPALAALDWGPGDAIAIAVRRGAIVVRPAEHTRRTIGAGNSLVLPIAARRMCAIPPGSSVLLVALPDADTLIIHPIAAIARLLARRHARILEGPS